MDARKRNYIKNKLDDMDMEYFTSISEHLSRIDKWLNELLAEQKQAFLSYTTCCFNAAETKYLGYWALMEEGLSEIEESAIENEYKERLKALEMERQKHIAHIKSTQEQLLDFTNQPFPLEKYERKKIDKEAS